MKASRTSFILSACMLLALIGCGPDGIFIRYRLDTPSHHVNNGNQLMKNGKLDAAQEEFNRAIELDPQYVEAYVGLGLVLGHKGDPEKGLQVMEKAGELSRNEEQRQQVEAGFQALEEMAPKD